MLALRLDESWATERERIQPHVEQLEALVRRFDPDARFRLRVGLPVAATVSAHASPRTNGAASIRRAGLRARSPLKPSGSTNVRFGCAAGVKQINYYPDYCPAPLSRFWTLDSV